MDSQMGMRKFLSSYFHHFNAGVVKDSAQAYVKHLEQGGSMLLAMAGAMSTGEIGRILSRMIREGAVHAISCTAANVEEEMFNLVAHKKYRRLPHYRDLSAIDEEELLASGYNRVTDTCIPEADAIEVVDSALLEEWIAAEKQGESYFFHEYFYRLIRSGRLEPFYQIEADNSWLVAAANADLTLVVPGWEDSTLGCLFAAHKIKGNLAELTAIKPGIEYTIQLATWYERHCSGAGAGFFQIGGGIAGDFAISIVPMLWQDLGKSVPRWSYYCQVGDSTTSYGSYSGAPANEKISWGKLSVDTPRFVIESDATIVAPLIFGYVMDL